MAVLDVRIEIHGDRHGYPGCECGVVPHELADVRGVTLSVVSFLVLDVGRGWVDHDYGTVDIQGTLDCQSLGYIRRLVDLEAELMFRVLAPWCELFIRTESDERDPVCIQISVSLVRI